MTPRIALAQTFTNVGEIEDHGFNLLYIRVIPNIPECSASRLFRIQIFGQRGYSIRDSNIILFVNYPGSSSVAAPLSKPHHTQIWSLTTKPAGQNELKIRVTQQRLQKEVRSKQLSILSLIADEVSTTRSMIGDGSRLVALSSVAPSSVHRVWRCSNMLEFDLKCSGTYIKNPREAPPQVTLLKLRDHSSG